MAANNNNFASALAEFMKTSSLIHNFPTRATYEHHVKLIKEGINQHSKRRPRMEYEIFNNVIPDRALMVI